VSVESFRQKARDRARTHYSWDAVTDDYEKLLVSLADHKAR
jgi:glycosyltransferase involved in cell wall biosynthesis